MIPTPEEKRFRELVATEVASQVAKLREEIRTEIATEVKRLDHRIDLIRRSLSEGEP